MEWYQGGIAEAVTLSRRNGAIFVVYIEGKDDKSKQMTELVNTEKVSKMLQNKQFVAILVEANSVAHQQFSEIYQQTSAPSIYFIGKTGLPIEIITEVVEPTQMITDINKIIVKNGDKPLEIEGDDDANIDLCKAETSSSNAPVEAASSSPAAENEPSIEEKLRLAQELIAKKRRQKEEEEKEKQRSKEVERRQMGQDMQKMKRMQQDQELRNFKEEHEKAKREDREARERVRRQIEEDKREKAARMNNLLPSTPPSAPEIQRPSVRPVRSDTARLQFRLPDGKMVTQDFKSAACLQEVIQFLEVNEHQTNFILSTTFPKREFTAADCSQTLIDLELVPNAAMLVLPSVRAPVANTNSGGITGLIWYLLTPFISILDYIKAFVFGTPRTPPTTNPDAPKRANPDPGASSSGSIKRRLVSDSKVRKQGNIHRLHDHDSDDENNTWNGNSTQQM